MPTIPLHEDFGPDRIKMVRKKYYENTAEFGKRFNVSAKTVEAWEQGRRKLKGPAQIIFNNLAAPFEYDKGDK